MGSVGRWKGIRPTIRTKSGHFFHKMAMPCLLFLANYFNILCVKGGDRERLDIDRPYQRSVVAWTLL